MYNLIIDIKKLSNYIYNQMDNTSHSIELSYLLHKLLTISY